MPTLSGQIERITYTSEESGFTVARVKVRGQSKPVTVVGVLMAPMAGELLEMEGEWATHPKFGPQFKVSHYHTKVPASAHGVEKYLGSGLIKGIGPVMAGRIVKRFGAKALDVIEDNIERLGEIDGIGTKRIEMIKAAWEQQREVRDVMLFLQSHGVSTGYAAKIYKRYGSRAIAVVQRNPFRLASDIFGIGFRTADKIAREIGFAPNSPERVQAGLLYVLNRLADEGHVYFPYDPLLERAGTILEVDREVLADGLAALVASRKIVLDDLNDDPSDFQENQKAVYLRNLYNFETDVATRLQQLMGELKAVRPVDTDKALDWVQNRLALALAPNQATAVRTALAEKAVVITGGPGTGKTTIINAILKILATLRIRILLAAPTGRAAKRMSETTGHGAKTIHRLLAYSLTKGGFQKNEHKPLKCDLLIVDEASMIDTALMFHLLKAVPPAATLILVGDVHQLPSVGAGNVLKDIIASQLLPVVTLTEIFRQARTSRIIVNAHKINSGRIPYFDPQNMNRPDEDFFFIGRDEPQAALETILMLVRERIPKRFGFDPLDDIQVLTPMHKGLVGAGNLNLELQKTLNPGQDGLQRGDRHFRVGDKVMQIKNNYDKEVFNGDIGRISGLNLETQEAGVTIEGRRVGYDFTDLDELVLAYAISVHKSQGSEYPAVVIPVLTQHFMLLQRNLLYTAVTRGKRLVVLVGTRKALAIAVKNDKTQHRHTLLRSRLQQ